MYVKKKTLKLEIVDILKIKIDCYVEICIYKILYDSLNKIIFINLKFVSNFNQNVLIIL